MGLCTSLAIYLYVISIWLRGMPWRSPTTELSHGPLDYLRGSASAYYISSVISPPFRSLLVNKHYNSLELTCITFMALCTLHFSANCTLLIPTPRYTVILLTHQHPPPPPDHFHYARWMPWSTTLSPPDYYYSRGILDTPTPSTHTGAALSPPFYPSPPHRPSPLPLVGDYPLHPLLQPPAWPQPCPLAHPFYSNHHMPSRLHSRQPCAFTLQCPQLSWWAPLDTLLESSSHQPFMAEQPPHGGYLPPSNEEQPLLVEEQLPPAEEQQPPGQEQLLDGVLPAQWSSHTSQGPLL